LYYGCAYSTLRQYYPIAFGQSRFVKHQGGFLWYLPFDSATSAQFSLRFLLQADGSFALQTYDGLYVGYDASVDQLGVLDGELVAYSGPHDWTLADEQPHTLTCSCH
jgi:hypothetical protein